MKGLEALNKLVNRIETDMNSDDYYKCKNAKDIVEKELEKAQLWDIIEPILFHSLQINVGLGSISINGDEYKLEKENFSLLDKALLMCIDKYKEK